MVEAAAGREQSHACLHPQAQLGQAHRDTVAAWSGRLCPASGGRPICAVFRVVLGAPVVVLGCEDVARAWAGCSSAAGATGPPPHVPAAPCAAGGAEGPWGQLVVAGCRV